MKYILQATIFLRLAADARGPSSCGYTYYGYVYHFSLPWLYLLKYAEMCCVRKTESSDTSSRERRVNRHVQPSLCVSQPSVFHLFCPLGV